ncbi:retrovirus polyprotein, putative [Perkinsus marinus ATCC 50983]|uniref:Retrovirus polyprotein, putative n=1 Tax=Perkinsus marinus (strain ATCC 50983 / TXsc) TaxID=423536 RepID=C5KTT3_PERM5|nr:retrovirus polyprotein, putative [Perkinsus marinus ATCC 50983]EER11975.1 retrovirus polyprotein, putative [Perkinsus marinus ATCC 50983]|eukprot:XP_002780180.1 retrovirus polyprotein, putative [Perkinsus marinus ATCC 50983]
MDEGKGAKSSYRVPVGIWVIAVSDLDHHAGKPVLGALLPGDDGLQGDDLAKTLEFAVPDFHDESVTFPTLPDKELDNSKYEGLCKEYSDLFLNRPGLSTVMEHSIPLTDPRPIAEKPRPIPHKWREDITRTLDTMEKDGIIQRSTSAYKFPCVYVPKKNGAVRMCIDYRRLNQVSVIDAYPIPRPDDVQEHLAGARVFSTLDLRSGYWQMPVRAGDRYKTAFCPGPGFPLYEWTRMPFGLCNAPAGFQRLMDFILGHLPFVRVYLDDILVFSDSMEQHLDHLRQVFDALRAAGLTLSGEKCSLGMSSVHYLGHIFGVDGMRPDPEKVRAIVEWPTPTTCTELRGFLGLAGYYRHFIPHFSDRARPLHQLVKETAKLEKMVGDHWTQDQEQAFNDLKQALTGLPSLDYPDFTRAVQIVCDASDFAIGGVIEQDGRPLMFFSQTLTGSQLNWPAYEKEAYALMKCLDRFRHFHLGYPLEVTIYSDHRPLQWIQTATSAKLQRWCLALQQYNFTVKYIPGSTNVRADALSRIRLPEKQGEGTLANPTKMVGAIMPMRLDDEKMVDSVGYRDLRGGFPTGGGPPPVLGALTLHPAISLEELKTAQADCPVIGRVSLRVADPSPLRREELRDPNFVPFKRIWRTLGLSDGILVREMKPSPYVEARWVPVVPPSLRSDLLVRFHEDEDHVGGFQRMLDKVQGFAYWPGMAQDIEQHLASCTSCINAKRPAPAPAPLTPMPIGRPWETIGVDLLSVPENADGISTLLVVQDYFTKWAHVVPLRQHTWKDVGQALYQLFLFFGPPLRLHSDQGPPFEGWMFKHVLGLLGIKKSKASVYHPAGNGLVERFNQTFLQLLRVHVATTYDWLAHLNSIVWHYTTSIHSSTRASPFYLMYGREAPSSWFPQLNHAETMLYDPEAYTRYIARVRATIADAMDQLTTKAAAAYKASFDTKAKKRIFTIGLRVRLETLGPQRANKLSPRWEADWYVAALLPGLEDKTVEIVHPATNRRKVVSVDHLLVDPLQPLDLPPEARMMIPAFAGPMDVPEVLIQVAELPPPPAPQVPIFAEFDASMSSTSLVDPPKVSSAGQEDLRGPPDHRQLPSLSSTPSVPANLESSPTAILDSGLEERGEGRDLLFKHRVEADFGTKSWFRKKLQDPLQLLIVRCYRVHRLYFDYLGELTSLVCCRKGLLLRELRDGMTRRWIVVEDLSKAMIPRKALGMTDRARAEGL